MKTKQLRRLRSYYKHFNKASFLVHSFDYLLGRRKMRYTTTKNGHNLYMRSNSSDWFVFLSSLVYSEINQIQPKQVPKTILDLGANIGTTAIAFAEKFPVATVIAIEPDPQNYSILLKNASSYTNIIPFHCAISNECGTVYLTAKQNNEPWGMHIARGKIPGSIKVPCVTIPVILKMFGLKQIDILKVDIEGAEELLFSTADEWIQLVGCIAVELHGEGPAQEWEKVARNFEAVSHAGEKVVAYK